MQRNRTLFGRFLIALLGIGFFLQAWGAPPESGGYAKLDMSGRGYQIEIQGSTMWIWAYAYASNGSPIYYLSAGQMTNPVSFTGTVYSYSGGQCFGCPFVTGATMSPPLGTVTIDFTSPISANMTFLGEQIQIVRFDATNYLSWVPDVMFGEWAIVDGSVSHPDYWGDRLVFNGVITDAGVRYITGNRSGDAARIVTAAWNATDQQLYVLMDYATDYYNLWIYNYSGFSRVEGDSFTYQKGSNPGLSMPSVGLRMNFKGESLFGAASAGEGKVALLAGNQSKLASAVAATDERARMRLAATAKKTATSFTDNQIALIRTLESSLRAQAQAASTK